MFQVDEDTFNRANADPIGAPWVSTNFQAGWGNLQIVGNLCEGDAVQNCDAGNHRLPYGPDHGSQITVSSVANTSLVGLALRSSAGGPSYRCYILGNTDGATHSCGIQRIQAGSFTSVASGTSLAFNPGDILYADIVGTTITFKQNGTTILTAVDSNIATGFPGIVMGLGAATTDVKVSDWKGFNSTLISLGANGLMMTGCGT